ncbi:hypothetical protein AB0952_02835 [Streptomyces caniferus]|uniref:hypothetical protein n=1 Tax=Streptomyces caniferus TaxID=285557 RepID=UPI00345243AC
MRAVAYFGVRGDITAVLPRIRAAGVATWGPQDSKGRDMPYAAGTVTYALDYHRAGCDAWELTPSARNMEQVRGSLGAAGRRPRSRRPESLRPLTPAAAPACAPSDGPAPHAPHRDRL